MFNGHKFIKLINNNWVLDLTDYKGYKVETTNTGECKNYTEAFKVNIQNNNEITIDKYTSIPVKVLKEAKNQTLIHEGKVLA